MIHNHDVLERTFRGSAVKRRLLPPFVNSDNTDTRRGTRTSPSRRRNYGRRVDSPCVSYATRIAHLSPDFTAVFLEKVF